MGKSKIIVAALGVLMISASQSHATDWEGFYAGLETGVGLGTSHIYDASVSSGFQDYNTSFGASGLFAGVVAGWNKQNGKYVWGVEADGEFNGLSGDNPKWPWGTDSTANVDFSGSLRLRGGVTIGNALVYVAGGLTLADMKADFYDTGNRHDAFQGLTVGWTAGAGIDYAVANDWTIGTEFRYTDYGSLKGQTITTDSGWYETNNLKDVSLRLSLKKKL